MKKLTEIALLVIFFLTLSVPTPGNCQDTRALEDEIWAMGLKIMRLESDNYKLKKEVEDVNFKCSQLQKEIVGAGSRQLGGESLKILIQI